jgi:hypothetical protein
VDGVEGFGLIAGHANALLSHDPKPRLLDQRVDSAGQIALGRVGFDDRECALNRHDYVLAKRWLRVAGLISALSCDGKRPGDAPEAVFDGFCVREADAAPSTAPDGGFGLKSRRSPGLR